MTRLGIWLLPFFAIVLLQKAVGQQTPPFWRGQDSVRLTEVIDWLQNRPHCACRFNGPRDRWHEVYIPAAQLRYFEKHQNQLGSFADSLDLLLLNSGYTAEVSYPTAKKRSVNLYQDPHSDYELKGRVVEAATGSGISYVRIGARRSGRATYSDAVGEFKLWVKERDTLTLERMQYQGTQVAVDARAGQKRLEIRLWDNRDNAVSTIRITDQEEFARLNLGLGPGVGIPAENVARMPGVGEGDIMQFASSLPAVSSNESAGALSMRGGNLDQNLYRLDGISLRQPQHFLGGFSVFNSQAMRGYDIRYMGFGPDFGRRLAGLILAEGRSGLEADNHGQAHGGFGLNLLNLQGYAETPLLRRHRHLDLGVHVSGRSSLSMLTPAGGNSLIYQRLISNRFQATDPALRSLTNTGTQVQLDPQNRFYDLNAKAELRIKEDDRVELTFFRAEDWLDYTERIRGEQAFYSDSLRTSNAGMSLAWFREWRQPRRDDWLWPKSQTYVAFSEFQNDYAYRLNRVDVPHFLRQDHQLTEWSLNHLTSWAITPRHEVQGGVEWTHLQQQSASLGRLGGYLIDSLERRQQSGIFSQFLNYTFSYPQNADSGDYLQVAVGMRHTYYTLNRAHYWEPRTSATYIFRNHRWHLRASWGRYLQFSTLMRADNRLNAGENMFVLAQGDSIDVLQAYHFNVGVFYRFSENWEFTLDAYRKDLTGLTMYHFGSGEVLAEQEPDALLTGGEGQAQGVELLGKFSYLSGFSGMVSYSLAQVQHRFGTLNEGNLFAAPQDQRHRITLQGQYQVDQRWFFSLRWDFASGLPYTPVEEFASNTFPVGDGTTELNFITYGSVNSQRLPAYHRLDLSCQYEFPLDAISTPGKGPVSGVLGLNLVNVYNQDNVGQRRYRVLPASLSQSADPELLTVDYRMLGFLPNVFVKLDF